MSAFAAILALGAAAGWIAAKGARAAARLPLRFACMLYAALAVAAAADIAPLAVSLIVTTLAAASLALAAFASFRAPPKPLPAALVLASTCLAGIAAAMTGMIALAAVPQLLCIVAVLALARRGLAGLRRPSVYLALASLALLAATSSLPVQGDAARIALLLFSAAGLLGVALASNVAVEERRSDGERLAVRRARYRARGERLV